MIIGKVAEIFILKLKSGNGTRFDAAMDRRYKEEGNRVISLINKSKNPPTRSTTKTCPSRTASARFLKIKAFREVCAKFARSFLETVQLVLPKRVFKNFAVFTQIRNDLVFEAVARAEAQYSR